jgi:dolichyl-phosphate-mannose--protein O-mannosyl transferase
VWWGGFAAAGVASVDWVARRRKLPCELVVTAFVAGLSGWLSLTVTGRTVHLYHAVPVTPFLYLALAYLAARVWSRRALRAAALAILLSVVGGFAYYLPILNAHPLSRDAWRPRGCSAISLWLSQIEACGLDSSSQSKSLRH